MMWQPIETAPKDRENVLCYEPSVGVFIGSADDDRGAAHWTVDWDDQFTKMNPTHWMPLPQPPEQQP